MTDHDPSTPSFDLPHPDTLVDDMAIAARIASRMFPEVTEPSMFEIGHYTLLRRLGVGGMGVVHAAEDRKLGRIVALKVLRSQKLPEQDRRRLINEARTLAKLEHPNIVQVYEVGQYGENVYFTMELVEGETLSRWQREHRHLDELLKVYLQAGAGLAAAHIAGFIHRDFKPSNVLVGTDGRVRVADFGLALPGGTEASTEDALSNDSRSGSTPRLVGTPGYIAPELYAGSPASERSDQFSFCVALWEAIARAAPFETTTFVEAVDAGRVIEAEGAVRPRWLRRALLRGLAFDPAARWPTLTDLLHHIERTRRIRRAVPIGAALLLAVVVPMTLVLVRDPEVGSCDMAGFDDVWNDERKAELLAGGDHVSMRAIADELDQYSRAWSSMHQEICEAHFEHRVLSGEGLDLAQGCMSELHQRAQVVVDSLLDGSTPSDRTDELLDSLPPPRVCQELRLQRARPLTTIARFVSANAARSQLEDIELTLAQGEYVGARRSAEALLAGVAYEGSTPEHAEALLLFGVAGRRLGEFEAARDHLESAAVEAELARHPEAQFRALLELAELTAYDLDHPDLAELALALAQAPLRELGEPPHLVAEFQTAAALLAETREDHARTETLLTEALALQERAGVGPRQRERTQLRIANSLAAQGRSDEALALYQQLLDAAVARLDAQHPDLGVLYFDIGLTWTELGNWAQARAFLESALDLQRASFGPDSARVAQVSSTLAEVETELGNYERAIELAEASVRIQTGSLPVDHPDRNAGQAALAWALLQRGDFQRSLDAHFALLDDLGPAWVDQRPSLHVTIGWLLCRLDRCHEAEPHVGAAKRSETGRVRAKAWALQVELELGHPELAAAALQQFEAELADLPTPIETQLNAEACWLRALVAAHNDDSRVAELARLANEQREYLHDDQIAKLAILLD